MADTLMGYWTTPRRAATASSPRPPSLGATGHDSVQDMILPAQAWVPSPLRGSAAQQHELNLVLDKALDEEALSLDDYLLEQYQRASLFYDDATKLFADHLTEPLERLRSAVTDKNGNRLGGKLPVEAAIFVQVRHSLSRDDPLTCPLTCLTKCRVRCCSTPVPGGLAEHNSRTTCKHSLSGCG